MVALSVTHQHSLCNPAQRQTVALKTETPSLASFENMGKNAIKACFVTLVFQTFEVPSRLFPYWTKAGF